MIYLSVKVLHLFAVFAWMAGLFYLPRLFVYHADQSVGSESDETFKVMERRLLAAIMRPAALFVFLSGALLVYLLDLSVFEPWLSIKILAVLFLFLFHGLLERHAAEFRRSSRSRSARYFRIINEVPTLLLLCILVMIVFRPFS